MFCEYYSFISKIGVSNCLPCSQFCKHGIFVCIFRKFIFSNLSSLRFMMYGSYYFMISPCIDSPSSWVLSKCCRSASRMHETLYFLLDHPRRCFIYLFPSHQTWFLFTIVLGLTYVVLFLYRLLRQWPNDGWQIHRLDILSRAGPQESCNIHHSSGCTRPWWVHASYSSQVCWIWDSSSSISCSSSAGDVRVHDVHQCL